MSQQKKEQELSSIEHVREMVTQSIEPDDFEEINRILDDLIDTRHLS